MDRIKVLPKSSAHLLTSTQVITSVYSVVKELIENSIDSKAKNIEVKLEDYGLDKIEVKDNGCGIHKEDICFVAKPHCTSKLSSHLDLVTVETYGFRGEALAALCAVSDLTISTKTEQDEFGFAYSFNHQGEVLSSKPCSLNQGTVVTALNLFKNIPVRKQIYRNSKVRKEELKKIEDTLIAFGCVRTELRFMLHHNKNLIWQKVAAKSTSEGLRQIFGCSVFEEMENFNVADDKTKINIEMFLPKANASKFCSQSSTCRTIVAVNKRPVRMKLFDKLLKEHFSKNFENDKPCYPTCFISIDVPTSEVDVNFEPNKTAVALQNNEEVIQLFSEALTEFYSKSTATVPSSSTVSPTKKITKAPCSTITLESSDDAPTCRNETEIPDFTPIEKQSNSQSFQKQLLVQPGTQSFTFSESSSKTQVNLKNLNAVKQTTLKEGYLSMSPRDIVVVNKKTSPPRDLNVSSSKKVKASSSISSTSNKLSRHLQAIDNFFTNSQAVAKNHEASPTSVNKTPLLVTLQQLGSNEDGNVMDKESRTISKPCSTFFTPQQKPDLDLGDKIINASHNENQNSLNISPGNSEWSKGIHGPNKNHSGPVAVLHPKLHEVNSNSKNTTNQNHSKEGKLDKEKKPNGILNKRDLTPFDFFCRRNRLEVAASNPEMSNQQLAQILSEKWNDLSSKEKAIYQDMASSNDSNKSSKNTEKQKMISSPGSKEDNTVQKSKKLRKKKYKHIEKTIPLNINEIENYNSSQPDYSFTEDMNAIGQVSPEIWICRQMNNLNLLNSVWLQETVIYNRLLQTFQLEAKLLDPPYVISSSSLDENEWDVIKQLDCSEKYGRGVHISDDRLVANGFDIKLLKEETDMKLEIIGVTEDIPFYSIDDLKEILSLIKVKGTSVNLSDSRPQKVINFLQGEAIRIARQFPSSKRPEDIEDLLEVSKSLSDTSIHSKPFLHEFYTIPVD